MAVFAHGASGCLRAGPRIAAELGPWSLDRPDALGMTALVCTAAVRQSDAFWLEHALTLTLDLDIGERVWRWPAVRVDGTANLSIRLNGDPEIV